MRWLILPALVLTIPLKQDALSDDLLKRLKEATVFIRVQMEGTTLQTGSGFLVRKTGESGIVITNSHVTKGPPSGAQVKVFAVFKSGEEGEFTLESKVIGDDPSRDLAMLRVKSGTLPSPIDLFSKAKLRETLPVYILGFPFGE